MGITPPKKPMEGGFSLDKFMPGLSPEDAEAFGKALETADLSDEPEPELCTCLWCQGSTPIETVVGECCWSGWKHQIDDLSKLVGILATKLRKSDPSNRWSDKAIDYLKRNNLQGSILRDE